MSHVPDRLDPTQADYLRWLVWPELSKLYPDLCQECDASVDWPLGRVVGLTRIDDDGYLRLLYVCDNHDPKVTWRCSWAADSPVTFGCPEPVIELVMRLLPGTWFQPSPFNGTSYEDPPIPRSALSPIPTDPRGTPRLDTSTAPFQ